MTIRRSIFVSILAVGLFVTLSRAPFCRGEGHGGGGHGGSHGHEAHHEAHHEEHRDGHPGEHRDAHHEEHRDAHQEHRDGHHEEHRDAHREGEHGEHHYDHHEAHHEEHPAGRRDNHPFDHRDAHQDWRRDDHREARHDDHDAHYDHRRFDHRDWYRHAWWHHQPTWHNQSWQHWWHHTTVNEIGAWSAGWGVGAPVYYDYGPGGNVVYRNDQVYVNGAAVGTAASYADSAIALANASPGTDATSDQAGDWLPLGTFAVLRNGSGTEPSLTMQLALSKSGSISGVLFDLPNDTSTPVHGSLDRATQRVAFDLGAKSGQVAETGLYNLAKDSVALLVHKGNEKPQTYTLVRFQSPPSGAKEADVAWSPE